MASVSQTQTSPACAIVDLATVNQSGQVFCTCAVKLKVNVAKESELAHDNRIKLHYAVGKSRETVDALCFHATSNSVLAHCSL